MAPIAGGGAVPAGGAVQAPPWATHMPSYAAAGTPTSAPGAHASATVAVDVGVAVTATGGVGASGAVRTGTGSEQSAPPSVAGFDTTAQHM